MDEISRVILPYGEDAKSIGRMKLESGFWAPTFFAIHADGSIIVPDFYHERLMNYDAKGTFVKSVPCPGLGPRLRSFLWNDKSQHYLMLNDQTISVVDVEGKIVGTYDFGMTIPDQLWISGDRVYVVIPVGGQPSTLNFDHTLKSQQSMNLQSRNRSIPVLRDDWQRLWGFTWQNMGALGNFKVDIAPDAILLKTAENGSSVWGWQSDTTDQDIWILDGQKVLIGKRTLNYSKTYPADGFWTVVSPDLNDIYKTFLMREGMAIVKYE